MQSHSSIGTARPLGLAEIHRRVEALLVGAPHIEVAKKIGMNSETVRRQRQSQAPSWLFLRGMQRVYGANLNWILSGEGEATVENERARLLRSADLSFLVAELGRRIGDLEGRVRTIESVRSSAEVGDPEQPRLSLARAIRPAAHPSKSSALGSNS